MASLLNPISFVVACLSGWLNEPQHHVIDYLLEENRVLREQIGDRRLRFSDDQRRRLAARAKQLSREALMQFAKIVTPDTLLAWHRKLIANKYDGSAQRKPGRPKIDADVEALVAVWPKKTGLGATNALSALWLILATCFLPTQLQTF